MNNNDRQSQNQSNLDNLVQSFASSSNGINTMANNIQRTNSITGNNNNNALAQIVNSVDLNSLLQNAQIRNELNGLLNIQPSNGALNVRYTTSQSILPTNNSNNTHTHSHSHSHPRPANNETMNGLNNSNNTDANNLEQVVVNLNGENVGNEQQQQADPNTPRNLFMLFASSMQSVLPFIVILVAKIFHQHLLGFFIVIGFLTTLYWSNKTLMNQVELKEKKQNLKLILLILFLLLNIFVFFYIFREYQLQNCLIFMSTNLTKMDLWNIVWILICSDLIMKFVTISLKSLITILPFTFMPLRRRGHFYSTIEYISLFYRNLVPIHPWILFLLYTESNDNKQSDSISNSATSDASSGATIFPIILCILYLLCKLNQLYNRYIELKQSIKDLIKYSNYGMPVSLNENEENICPICQDKLSDPIALKCKHTFCQDCVCVWLDKENSCPMCRARIALKKPLFRDGSSSFFIHFF